MESSVNSRSTSSLSSATSPPSPLRRPLHPPPRWHHRESPQRPGLSPRPHVHGQRRPRHRVGPAKLPFAPPPSTCSPPPLRPPPPRPPLRRPLDRVGHLPYADTWRYPLSNLSGLARDLTAILTLCPPCGGANIEAERDREEEVTGPLVTRLCRDAARFRAKAEEDIERLWAEQAVLRGRARAVDAAREELEEEREGLERALARKVRDTRVISEWLGSVCGGANELSDGEGFEEGDETSRRLVANAAAELAIDETVDALTVALEKGLVGVKVYLKQVRALAREQFFHRRMVIQKWSI
uniref:SB domain-containing protein n=1 Tax=Ananas comosus var. bracteatus TaxID=296719 RepID=A0A6V7QSR9_ANACO